MLVVRDGYDHGVHILAVQDLAITARCGYLLLHGLLSRLVTAVIKIAHRDTFDARHRERRLQKFASTCARADRGKSDAITRRYGAAGAP